MLRTSSMDSAAVASNLSPDAKEQQNEDGNPLTLIQRLNQDQVRSTKTDIDYMNEGTNKDFRAYKNFEHSLKKQVITRKLSIKNHTLSVMQRIIIEKIRISMTNKIFYSKSVQSKIDQIMNSKSRKEISKILLKLDLKKQVIEYNDDHWDDIVASAIRRRIRDKEALGTSKTLMAVPK